VLIYSILTFGSVKNQPLVDVSERYSQHEQVVARMTFTPGDASEDLPNQLLGASEVHATEVNAFVVLARELHSSVA